MFAMQAQEETSRGVEIYLAVTRPLLRLGVRGEPARRLHRAQRAGARPARRASEGRPIMNLDFGFFNWQLVQSFILKGLAFSVS